MLPIAGVSGSTGQSGHQLVLCSMPNGSTDGFASPDSLAFCLVEPAAGRVWELKLAKPLSGVKDAELSVSVKDKQGNISRAVRAFTVP